MENFLFLYNKIYQMVISLYYYLYDQLSDHFYYFVKVFAVPGDYRRTER